MEFNPQKQLAGLLEWMDQQMTQCGGKTAVIGISGGKDSSTVAALAVAAYGRENVYGVLMPNGVQPDIDYSQALVEHLQIPHCTINIHDAVQGVLQEMEKAGLTPSRQTAVNLPSRVRMATLYAVAQTLPAGIVINTSNLSEDWVGYCTIYGDSAGAFSPLGMYTTEEVIALGRELGLPEARLPLAEAAILLATAPKSNSAHNAIIAAMDDIRRGRVGQVPRHLQNVHADGTGFERDQGYLYPHNFPNHWVRQQYLPDVIKDRVYYTYGDNKTEQAAKRYWDEIKK